MDRSAAGRKAWRTRRFRAWVDIFDTTEAADAADYQPRWRTIVGPAGSQTGFRRWLKKQPKAYQIHINSTQSEEEILNAITEFFCSFFEDEVRDG